MNRWFSCLPTKGNNSRFIKNISFWYTLLVVDFKRRFRRVDSLLIIFWQVLGAATVVYRVVYQPTELPAAHKLTCSASWDIWNTLRKNDKELTLWGHRHAMMTGTHLIIAYIEVWWYFFTHMAFDRVQVLWVWLHNMNVLSLHMALLLVVARIVGCLTTLKNAFFGFDEKWAWL